MKISIAVTDIMIAPGKRFDPAKYTQQDVIARIKKLYGVIAGVMDIVIDGEMVHLEFRDATPERHSEAMGKLRRQAARAC
jgi:hypothetical protein